MSKKNTTNEIGKYTEIKEKLTKACAENGLTFTVQNKGYPFLLTIKPLGGMDAQQAMIEGMDTDSETGYISPDATLVFAYRDGNLTYKISETFTISDKLFNKIKGLFQKLHDMWMQYFYRDVYEHNAYLAPENRTDAPAEEFACILPAMAAAQRRAKLEELEARGIAVLGSIVVAEV